MRKSTAIILASAVTMLLSGCTDRLFARVRPDEFAVQRQAPLYVPPDFALTPPTPGAPRPAQRSAQQDALAAMFGGEAGKSPVETAALRKAGFKSVVVQSRPGPAGSVCQWWVRPAYSSCSCARLGRLGVAAPEKGAANLRCRTITCSNDDWL